VRSYLKAAEATNSDDPKTVIAKMREMPVHDAFTSNGMLRSDGRMVHDVYLVQIKRTLGSACLRQRQILN
jgi:branched-chain amino acid transport system substrate-binding protein